MKKKALLGVLILSTLSFGAVKGNNKMEKRGMNYTKSIESLSEEKKVEFKKEIEAKREEIKKESIEIKEKELEMKKIMLNENPDWNRVEALNKEIYSLRGEQRFDQLKFSKEIEEKYDVKLRGNQRKERSNKKKNSKESKEK